MELCASCEALEEEVHSQVYFGVTIQNNFLWNKQVEILIKRMRHISASIYHMQNLVSKETKRIGYFALLESIL